MASKAKSSFLIFIFRPPYDFDVLSIPFQQLIQNVGENAKFGYSLEDIIKWYVTCEIYSLTT